MSAPFSGKDADTIKVLPLSTSLLNVTVINDTESLPIPVVLISKLSIPEL